MSKSQHARFVKWKAPINEECSDADFVCHSSDAVRERRQFQISRVLASPSFFHCRLGDNSRQSANHLEAHLPNVLEHVGNTFVVLILRGARGDLRVGVPARARFRPAETLFYFALIGDCRLGDQNKK